MIPDQIVEYLERRNVPYQRRSHRRALTAQEVAACMHVTGYRVGKAAPPFARAIISGGEFVRRFS